MSWLDYEAPLPILGPGKSRPKPTERVRLYRVRVTIPDKPKMTITLPAPTRRKAILYCQNRWPNCTAEVVE